MASYIPDYLTSSNTSNGSNYGLSDRLINQLQPEMRPKSELPKVPPTPGPKSKSNIEEEALDRFAGIIWVQKEKDRQVDDYFVDYDYWEVYSETKSYSKRSYQAAYTGRMREYHNYLCILRENDDDQYYVIAKRIRTELELLEPYCTCIKCTSSVINPLKYIWCDHCTKCIKAGYGFASQEYIDEAKRILCSGSKRKYSYIPRKHDVIVSITVLLGLLLIMTIY